MGDIVKLFRYRDEDITHELTYADGVYTNTVCVDGRKSQSVKYCTPQSELEYKRYAKRTAQLAVYRALSDYFGETMPWGALTGIRPTKLAYSELEQGRDFAPLLREMGVCEENIRLLQDVLTAQKGIYSKEGGTDLFVSIPFCPTKCAYCSFITADIAYTKQYLERYTDALVREILFCKGKIKNLKSVYIGGGTPLVMPKHLLERILQAIEEIRTNGCEYTVEAGRPDVFTEEKLDLLARYGVTRICVNPQTFTEQTLRNIGRKHTVEQVYAAFAMAKKYPFSVNCDLIAGLEGESKEEFLFGVREAIRMDPDNITVHTLCLKKGAKMKESCSYLDAGDISEMIEGSRKLLYAAGYVPYYLYRQKYMAGNCENTGWTKPGKACVYNIDIMEETCDNLACGENAVSKRVFANEEKIVRFGTPKDIKMYIERQEELLAKKAEFFGWNEE